MTAPTPTGVDSASSDPDVTRAMSVAYLGECFEADFEAGTLTWKARRAGAARDRRISCRNAQGYAVVTLCSRQLRVHRVLWALAHGEWPSGAIDHINGDKLDNRAVNLRLGSGCINAQNRFVARKDSALGVLGVCRKGNKFRAQIGAGGYTRYLGVFETPELAHAAYVKAKRELHPGGTL